MIIKCENCNGHSDASVNKMGEVYFSCDHCDFVGAYEKLPDEVFGDIMICYGTGNPNSNEYVLLTMLAKDGQIKFFVLSNTKVLYDGEQMYDAVQIYVAQTKKVE